MPSKNSPPPLQTLGNYNLLEQLGAGSMGSVYKARHWETGQIVAIKIMASRIARNATLLKRFELEFRVASKLDHPNIVRALDYSVVGDTPLLVMEYVEGESIGQKLDRERRLSEEAAVHIIVQVAQGLHCAHRQGLIHRDIKPDNIMVTPEGKAMILDLGLAKEIDAAAELTRTGAGLGTPNFMAPEQFRNAKHVDVRSDVYSLAATLYMMLTGEMPFGVTDPLQILMRKLRNELPPVRERAPEISERTEWTIKRAMSTDASQRPASCREFAEDLIGQSTRALGAAPAEEVVEWYMVFRNPDGILLTATGTTRGLYRSIEDGQLGNAHAVRASREKAGPFEPLTSFPEFRDLVVGAAPGPPLSEAGVADLGRVAWAAGAGERDREPPPVPSGPSNAETQRDLSSRAAGGIPAGRVPAPAQPAAAKAPHFQLVSSNLPPVNSVWSEGWKLIGLVLLTVLTTLLAGRHLLPLFQ